jgi:dihydrofolate synthase/folylpolyglutamate synthase
MTYAETLDYLFSQLPMFSRIGAAAYKKDITNTIELCKALGDPQKKFKSIHIAGTNGKGSTSHMLAAIFQAAGYKTGLYTSPHLQDFRERIRINGAMCSEEFVVAFTEGIQEQIQHIEPSFFEITVAMAFNWFAQEQVDIAIIETGLGGRLDSTNIVLPELSIITNIGYDHMNLLGDTLPLIAAEKAGIIKPGIPVVIGEYLPATRPVFEEKARSTHSPIFFASDEWEVLSSQYEYQYLHALLQHREDKQTLSVSTDLSGSYQLKNLLSIAEACRLLRKQGWAIDIPSMQTGLQQVKRTTGLHGRWELISMNPALILDVGHNEDGIKAILHQLQVTAYDHLHIVTGMVKDKEVDKVLSLLPATASYYFTQAHIPRALEVEALQQQANLKGLTGDCYADVNEAIATALQRAKPHDLVLVCGSVFLVGEVDRTRFESVK